MSYLACFLIGFLCFADALYNGKPVPESWDLSWIVSLQKLLSDGSFKHQTFGVLIDNRILLSSSSANFWINAVDNKAYASVKTFDWKQRQMIKILKIVRHPGYNSEATGGKQWRNDLALILLEEIPIHSKNVALPNATNEFFPDDHQIQCIITGWNTETDGHIDTTMVHYVHTNKTSNDVCQGSKSFDENTMFCSGIFSNEEDKRLGGCQEDLGTPYMCKLSNGDWTVFGVLSQIGSEPCLAFAPNVYMDITKYLPWLRETAEKLSKHNRSSDGNIKNDNAMCLVYKDTDFYAEKALESVHGQPFSACCDLCKKAQNCSGYAWNDYRGGTCWLKSGPGPLVKSIGVKAALLKLKIVTNGGRTNGTKNHHEECLTYEDTDFRTEKVLKPVHNKTFSACCDLCKSARDCSGYTWNDYNGGTCWLKAGSGELVKKSGMKAGLLQVDKPKTAESVTLSQMNSLKISAPVTAAIILLFVACLYIMWRKKRKSLKSIQTFPRISKDQIKTLEKIGEGHFCEVWKGSYDQQKSGSRKPRTVAVKLLKLNAGEREIRQFLEEAMILDKIKGQPHIISAVGVCLNSRPHFLVLEYMNGGSLLSFLRAGKNRNKMAHKKLLQIALDVCDACCYLEKMGYIHRDIAARNCLVDLSRKDELVVKLTDFGLAKDEKAIYLTPDPDLPVAWVAPEGFSGAFSIKSDVWAYGVLLWEVFSYGAEPFGKCSNNSESHICPIPHQSHYKIQCQVCENKKTLLDMPVPCTAQFTEFLREVMGKCWHYSPDDRPSFSEINQLLQEARETADFRKDSGSSTQSSHVEEQKAKPKTQISVTSDGESDGYNRITVSVSDSVDSDLAFESLQEAYWNKVVVYEDTDSAVFRKDSETETNVQLECV